MSKLSILTEFWECLTVRKKCWLAPIVFFLLLFGTLIVLTEGKEQPVEPINPLPPKAGASNTIVQI